MSHIVTIQTQVRDPVALAAACRRLDLAEPTRGNARLFNGQVKGLLIQLPGWRYAVVAQPETGNLLYDNYKGAWGAQAELDRLLQAYAVEKARIEARKAGHSLVEQALPDGSIKLTLQVGGGT